MMHHGKLTYMKPGMTIMASFACEPKTAVFGNIIGYTIGVFVILCSNSSECNNSVSALRKDSFLFGMQYGTSFNTVLIHVTVQYIP